MNDKMIELYRQAQVPGIAIDPTNNMHYETTHFSAEKFAELIVKECIELTKQCSTGKGIHDLYADEIIAQHFGVEE